MRTVPPKLSRTLRLGAGRRTVARSPRQSYDASSNAVSPGVTLPEGTSIVAAMRRG